MVEHHRTSSVLKTTAADNKILISQHQGALQREREQWNVRMAEQERMLEKARNEMAQEVATQKERQQFLENEKYYFYNNCCYNNYYYYCVIKTGAGK